MSGAWDMAFSGLAGADVLRWLGIAAGAIVLLYLLRVQRRQVQVPFARLFQQVSQPKAVSAWWRLLRRLLSLLLQLTVAALIAFALLRPVWTGERPPWEDWSWPWSADGDAGEPDASSDAASTSPEPPHTTLLVVDTTASLGATDADGGRLSRALQAAHDAIHRAAAADRFAIATASTQLRLLTPFTSDRALLDQALLQRVRPEPTAGGVDAVWRDVRTIALHARHDAPGEPAAAGDPNPVRVVVLSDSAPSSELPTEDLQVSWVDIASVPNASSGPGASAGSSAIPVNAAIAAFEARPYLDDPLTYELYLRVQNHSGVPLRARVALYAARRGDTPEQVHEEGAPFDTLTLELAAHGHAEQFLRQVEVPAERVLARLTVEATSDQPAVRDVLAADDEALALLAERRRLRVLLVTEGNLYLEAALFVREHVQFEKIAPEAWSGPGTADLVIFDRFAPAGDWPAGHYLAIAPPADRSLFELADPVALPRLRTSKERHPLMWKVSLADLNVEAVTPLGDSTVPGAQTTPLVSLVEKGNADGATAIALLQHAERGLHVVQWGFEVERSDLPLRYAFPLLLVNTLNWFYAEAAALRSGKVAGTDWAIALERAPSGVSGAPDALPQTVTVRAPDGTTQVAPVVDGRALLSTDQVGFWTVAPDSELERVVAASFRSPTESAQAVQSNSAGDSASSWAAYAPANPDALRAAAHSERKDQEPWRRFWKWALALCVFLLAVEWWTYQRRITV